MSIPDVFLPVKILRPSREIVRRTGGARFKRTVPFCILYTLNNFLKITIMKKIFMLLMAVGMVGFASAQSRGFDHGRQDAVSSMHDRQSGVDQINRSYDYRIAAVKQNRYMNFKEKNKQIKLLNKQRDMEIARIQVRFKNEARYDNRGYARGNKNKW
jgi:TolA-binding protein